MLRSNKGPVVMEVNSSPGLEGIEKATGKDIAGMAIEFLEKNTKPNRTKTKGKEDQGHYGTLTISSIMSRSSIVK